MNELDSVLLRHPEKRRISDAPKLARPSWIRGKSPTRSYADTRSILRKRALTTVCEEAACPNIGECWAKKHATFMILGAVCTRACAFCNVETGKPKGVDLGEPDRIASAVEELGLEHVVITSVDRDDLDDGGAKQFRDSVLAIRSATPEATIEILTPDFRNKHGVVDILMQAPADVFNHNIETVPRLYAKIRPGARYFTSLQLLAQMKQRHPQGFTKSGMMLGLGESDNEVLQVMDDLRAANVDFITIGQYLQPTPRHAGLQRYVSPAGFARFAEIAKAKGFLMVASSPMTRSSYHAGDDFRALKIAREKAQAHN